ncbi:MAG: DUF4143 domain-containing protein [Acidimicrobiales bacterium]
MSITIRVEQYHRRVLDTELDQLIGGGIAAIAVEGAKAVGKSATAAERTQTVFLLEEPATRQLLEADPGRIVTGESVLIDEWQRVPTTWDVVRRAVDRGARPGQFLLTGSASAQNPGTHSGAGRIVKLRMRPMTLPERDVDTPSVSVAQLLTGSKPKIEGDTSISLECYVDEICRSGFPGIHQLADVPRRAQLSGYIDRIIDRDIADLLGTTVRYPSVLRRWFAAYAAAISSTATYETIRDAASAGEASKPTRVTLDHYRGILESLYVLEPVPAWVPSNNHIAELGAAPKHQLIDPAIAVSLLGLGPAALLSGEDGGVRSVRDGTLLGALFESLVALDVRVFAQAEGASVGHLRLHRGDHEVDLIVERPDRRVVAFEVKLAAEVNDDDVKHLVWLQGVLGENLLDAAVVTTGPYAYRRKDGIAVVPLALLGP